MFASIISIDTPADGIHALSKLLVSLRDNNPRSKSSYFSPKMELIIVPRPSADTALSRVYCGGQGRQPATCTYTVHTLHIHTNAHMTHANGEHKPTHNTLYTLTHIQTHTHMALTNGAHAPTHNNTLTYTRT